MRVRHVHSSSRFDRAIGTLIRAIVRYLTLADLITFTEVREVRRRPLVARFSTWQVLGGKGEAALMVRRTRWKMMSVTTITLDEEIAEGKRPVVALRVRLEHRRTDRTLVVYVFHVPAHHDRPEWLASWHQCIAKLSVMWRAEKDPCIFTGDWNKDWRKADNQKFLRNQFPKGHWTWERKEPRRGGTHHHRLIDYSVTSHPIVRARLVRDDSSSDHRPFRETVRI